ncbi:hypothetical protein RRG08_050677 [Elysia crispata]|uniref:Uncharacterized protein n=1 Tax=Elysia crispata TaxID=231223 RepID=A0AAE1A4W5_9GAST|nr:hypothetical protein RRG08_050677 [Elysia crispata]
MKNIESWTPQSRDNFQASLDTPDWSAFVNSAQNVGRSNPTVSRAPESYKGRHYKRQMVSVAGLSCVQPYFHLQGGVPQLRCSFPRIVLDSSTFQSAFQARLQEIVLTFHSTPIGLRLRLRSLRGFVDTKYNHYARTGAMTGVKALEYSVRSRHSP